MTSSEPAADISCGSEDRPHVWKHTPEPHDRCEMCGERYTNLPIGWHDVGPTGGES